MIKAKKVIRLFFNRISGDSSVISINFDDNLIRTLPSNPFEYFSNLESISVANNLIRELTKGLLYLRIAQRVTNFTFLFSDFLKSTSSLKILNLSNNSLSSIDPSIFAQTKALQEIDLSLNEFTKLSADLLENLSSVEIMRMENNKMFTIDSAFSRVDYKLRQMFLGYNQFTVITAAMLEKFVKL